VFLDLILKLAQVWSEGANPRQVRAGCGTKLGTRKAGDPEVAHLAGAAQYEVHPSLAAYCVALK
jgi:hypothetical protein